MRPCRQCRTPIENRDATCPYCGSAQDTAPKLNSEPPRTRSWRQFTHDLLAGLSDNFGLGPVFALLFLTLPLALGVVIGFAVAERAGAQIGFAVALVLLIGVVAWAETGADGARRSDSLRHVST